MKSVSKSNNLYEIHCEPIDVTPMEEPNPNWKYKCKCGKIYTWKNPPKFIPVKEITDIMFPHFKCPNCEELIPTYSMFRTPKEKIHIKGPIECRINGELVTKEIFEKAFKKDHPNIKI